MGLKPSICYLQRNSRGERDKSRRIRSNTSKGLKSQCASVRIQSILIISMNHSMSAIIFAWPHLRFARVQLSNCSYPKFGVRAVEMSIFFRV